MKDQPGRSAPSTLLEERDSPPGRPAETILSSADVLKAVLQLAAKEPVDFYLKALAPARNGRRARAAGRPPAPRPRCFVVRLSGRWNLACEYCFDAINRAFPRDLDRPTARRIADYILSVPGASPLVSLIGGEPLLNWEIGRAFVETLRREGRARGKQPCFNIVTNGTPITREMARELARDDITVQISLDGPARDGRGHRSHPDGTDSYPEALRGLRRLRAARPDARVDAQVVLTPDNLDLTGLARRLEAAGFRRIRFLHDTPGGKCRRGWPRRDVRALMRAREEFYPHFLRSVLRGRPEVDTDLAMLVASQPSGPGGLCTCGRGEVYIDTRGDLYACPRLYGQPGVRPLGHCAAVDPAAPLPFPWNPRPRDPRCGRCWAFDSCRGGCAFRCQRCALDPSDPGDPNQELWCDLLRTQFARAAITHRFLKRFHPERLESLRALFPGVDS